MLQAGEGAQHAARANDAGGAQQLGLHFIAAGLQLLGQLFQTQQLGSALQHGPEILPVEGVRVLRDLLRGAGGDDGAAAAAALGAGGR